MLTAASTKRWITILNVLFGIGLIPSIIACAMSFTLFDSMDDENKILIWALFLCLFTFPILIICSIPISRIYYRKEKYKQALLISMLPIISILILAIVLAIMMISLLFQNWC